MTQAARDQDEDGIADGFDNCVAVANADQLDNEGDGVGDVCDNDDDNDGIADADDQTIHGRWHLGSGHRRRWRA